jgi:hypothetical protein
MRNMRINKSMRMQLQHQQQRLASTRLQLTQHPSSAMPTQHRCSNFITSLSRVNLESGQEMHFRILCTRSGSNCQLEVRFFWFEQPRICGLHGCECTVQHCVSFKQQLWCHILDCRNATCAVPHCKTSRYITNVTKCSSSKH